MGWKREHPLPCNEVERSRANLVPELDAAVAVAERHEVARGVAQDLHFHVPGVLDVRLHVD